MRRRRTSVTTPVPVVAPIAESTQVAHEPVTLVRSVAEWAISFVRESMAEDDRRE